MSEQNGAVVKVSRSKAIMRVLKDKGIDTPAKDIASALKAEGIEVSIPLVNNVKTRIRQARAERKATRRNRRVSAPADVISPVQSSFDQLLEVKAFAAKFGGSAKVREMLDALDKLSA